MWKHAGIVLMVALLVGGCAWLQDQKASYDVGKSTALAEGEKSPDEAARGLIDPVLPYLPEPVKPVAGVLVSALALFGTWRRGSRIRNGKSTSVNPITGGLGEKVKVESVVQTVASVASGLFDLGEHGSGLRRGWKATLAGTIAASVFLIPGVKEFVGSQPEAVAGYMAIASAFVLGLQKELDRVLVVKKPV